MAGWKGFVDESAISNCGSRWTIPTKYLHVSSVDVLPKTAWATPVAARSGLESKATSRSDVAGNQCDRDQCERDCNERPRIGRADLIDKPAYDAGERKSGDQPDADSEDAKNGSLLENDHRGFPNVLIAGSSQPR